MRRDGPWGQRGFTIVDLVAVVAIIGIVSAIGVPSMLASMDRIRLGQAAREVEREVQTAKSRAVAKGRPVRIRFDCPAAGQYRVVELLGTASAPLAADDPVARCDGEAYPYPPADSDPLTRPNLDGPPRTLDESVTFQAAQTIEFLGDGTARYDTGVGPWSPIPLAGIQIRLVRNEVTKTITVNGLGKVQLQ